MAIELTPVEKEQYEWQMWVDGFGESGQQKEPRPFREDGRGLFEQRRQVAGKLPGPPLRTPAEGGRIQDDAIVALPALLLAGFYRF